MGEIQKKYVFLWSHKRGGECGLSVEEHRIYAAYNLHLNGRLEAGANDMNVMMNCR